MSAREGLGIFLLILFGMMPFSSRASASSGDALLAELRADGWQEHFSGVAGQQELDHSLDALLDVTNNGGVDWRIRIRGIFLLSKTSGPRKVDILMEMFNDSFFSAECPAIKTSLVRALSSIGYDARIVDVLMKGTNDGEPQVREAAVLALGKMGDQRAVPLLIGKLSDPSLAIRLGAIRSLVQIRDSRAVPYLKEVASGDRDNFVRNEALAALSEIGS
jgi:HEAT repeat protein